jgi:hypothetical protein
MRYDDAELDTTQYVHVCSPCVFRDMMVDSLPPLSIAVITMFWDLNLFDAGLLADSL